jgi:hypothetical protein
MRAGKEKTRKKTLTRSSKLALSDSQEAARAEYVTAGRGVGAPTEIFGLFETLIGSGQLFLMGQGIGRDRLLTDGLIGVVKGGVEISEQAQSIVIHPAPHHCLRLQEFELRSPLGIGNTKLSVILLGFLLAICKVALLKDMQGMIIRNLSAARTCVLQWNQKQQ